MFTIKQVKDCNVKKAGVGCFEGAPPGTVRTEIRGAPIRARRVLSIDFDDHEGDVILGHI
jgi:hypothetical protein